jgi:hypothetical protein
MRATTGRIQRSAVCRCRDDADAEEQRAFRQAVMGGVEADGGRGGRERR